MAHHHATASKFDIFYCCRLGDLDNVRHLVEDRGMNLNVRDQWDSTPLYYACLCGHTNIVDYLLSRGARCDAATFDGERCIYGALTDDIRRTLLHYSVLTTRQRRRDPYEEFLRRLYESGVGADITFRIRGNAILAHKCILAARCPWFKERFQSLWRDRNEVDLVEDHEAFGHLLEWIYTAQVTVDFTQLEDLKRLSHLYCLDDLVHELEEAIQRVAVRSKRDAKIKQVQIGTPRAMARLQDDLQTLADLGMTGPDKTVTADAFFYDLILRVDDSSFLVHKVFLTARSDFFRGLISDHFDEAKWNSQQSIPVIPLRNVSPQVMAQVIRHVYSDQQRLNEDLVLDVLQAADMFLIPGLKRQCGNFFAKHCLSVDTVVHFVHTARLYDLPRLESQCTEFMARHIRDKPGCSHGIYRTCDEHSLAPEHLSCSLQCECLQSENDPPVITMLPLKQSWRQA